MDIPSIDLDSFIKELEVYKGKGYQLTFSGLTYSRLKHASDTLIQTQFAEPVYLDEKGLVVVDNLT